jgi:hypothetical protein
MSIKSGSIIYGNDKHGNDIYKDSKGYYVILWNPKKGEEYKKYMGSKRTRKAIAKKVCTNTRKCKWVSI